MHWSKTNKRKSILEKISKSKTGLPIHTQKHKENLSKRMQGNKYGKGAGADEKHPNWKGELVSYSGLHKWVTRKLGTPKYCANCKTTTAKKYEWANISHCYKRELSDWIRLCTKCHIGFDRGLLTITIS
jgi:hypothetical protein